MFLLFINDVTDRFVDMDFSCKLYADDIKLYSRINTTLPRDDAINKLHQWSKVWQQQIAVDKRFVRRIPPGNRRATVDLYSYVLNTQILDRIDVVPDLGFYIDCYLKFDCHVSLTVHKAMSIAPLIL